MRLSNAIEGGITGATTLTLLQEALHKIDHDAPRPFLYKSGIIKELKKNKKKPGRNTSKLYIKLASELLANVGSFGLIGLGNKKNVVLRGTLLGAAVGLGSAFLQNDHEEDDNEYGVLENTFDVNGVSASEYKQQEKKKDDLKKKLLTVALYTAGGFIAGTAIQQFNKKSKKFKGRNKFSKLIKGK